jgi:hypothetical protein
MVLHLRELNRGAYNTAREVPLTAIDFLTTGLGVELEELKSKNNWDGTEETLP